MTPPLSGASLLTALPRPAAAALAALNCWRRKPLDGASSRAPAPTGRGPAGGGAASRKAPRSATAGRPAHGPALQNSSRARRLLSVPSAAHRCRRQLPAALVPAPIFPRKHGRLLRPWRTTPASAP